MKCPNCGLEVVIATDMCPQCGYSYNFDGSILPPAEEPQPRESGAEEKVGAFRKRSHRDDAGERWTRAGVYSGRSTSESTARENDAQTTVTLGMAWYGFILRLLPIVAIVCLYRGVMGASTAISELASPGFLYIIAPWLGILAFIDAFAYLLAGGLALASISRLKAYDWRGVKMYIVLILVPSIVDAVYGIALGLYVDLQAKLVESCVQLFATIIFVALNIRYFSRRRHMFSGGTR